MTKGKRIALSLYTKKFEQQEKRECTGGSVVLERLIAVAHSLAPLLFNLHSYLCVVLFVLSSLFVSHEGTASGGARHRATHFFLAQVVGGTAGGTGATASIVARLATSGATRSPLSGTASGCAPRRATHLPVSLLVLFRIFTAGMAVTATMVGAAVGTDSHLQAIFWCCR